MVDNSLDILANLRAEYFFPDSLNLVFSLGMCVIFCGLLLRSSLSLPKLNMQWTGHCPKGFLIFLEKLFQAIGLAIRSRFHSCHWVSVGSRLSIGLIPCSVLGVVCKISRRCVQCIYLVDEPFIVECR